MTTPTLETIVRHNILSLDVEHLRVIAHDHCGIPRDNAYLVDLWLYEQLALAANFMGPHFGIADTAQTLRSIECGLISHYEGTFLEKCASSWAELVANPIIRHEIMLPWSWCKRDYDREPVVDAWANESFSDVVGLLATTATWR